MTPRLSPAYDIVMTKVYIQDERSFALNLARNKNWLEASMQHFEKWADKAGIPWRIIKPHLDDILDRARQLWPDALRELPMIEQDKNALKAHLNQLHADFIIAL